VYAAFAAAAVLHLLWVRFVADAGGDLAAQDAWAAFARSHPGSAYNLAWYGGMYPVSYSAISPYVMAILGVRTTMVLAGTISAAILAYLIIRTGVVRRPLWPALYGAVALTGNAVSGRATFGLGVMFGLAAVACVVTWPAASRPPGSSVLRTLPAAVLAALATAASPVAGLFLGIAAAALWLEGRRVDGATLGVPPVLVLAVSALLFPFAGRQPMPAVSMILPVVVTLALMWLSPRSWRVVRIGSVLYVGAVFAAWVIPSPVGSNITRLGLLFGGVLVVAVAATRLPSPARLFAAVQSPSPQVTGVLAATIITSSVWQVGIAARDVMHMQPTESQSSGVQPLIDWLAGSDARLGRIEAVPTQSHREAAALAPYVNLARGWNRQADEGRNPIFYEEDLLTAASYRAWLDRWAVRYVVVSSAPPDSAAVGEEALVSQGLPYLRLVWASAGWTLYRVASPQPIAGRPATVTRFGAAGLVLRVPRPATVLVRIPSSPWLTLVDAKDSPIDAPFEGCLSTTTVPETAELPSVTWTVLHAPHAGTYRISAPYSLARGSPCGDD
jgi:hypothetical protein